MVDIEKRKREHVDIALKKNVDFREKTSGFDEIDFLYYCLPEMDFDREDGAYCEQYCNLCTTVCPTGAIQFLSEEEKQQRKIATAKIRRGACIAWEDRKECLACDEFCGYNAFELSEGEDGIPQPTINQRKCRGCGACRNICPAIDGMVR